MKYTKTIKSLNLDNKIVECTVNAQGQWEFMRERTDKTLPNSYNTAICKLLRLSPKHNYMLFFYSIQPLLIVYAIPLQKKFS